MIVMQNKFLPSVLLLCTIAAAQTKPANHNFARWEKEISALEQKDRTNPPAEGGVVFVGSSTIKRWKSLSDDFPGHNVINHGFGGSQIIDAAHFADRIIIPHQPKMVFLRSGGNDIHAGKTPQQVFGDYKEFVAKVRAKLPDTTIVFIGLSPAPVRWEEREANKQLNALVEEYTRQTPGLKYIEAYAMTVAADGQPRRDLFVADQLHFNAEGYKLLAERVRPVLQEKASADQ
jgi:lysophospholipase L1-like esterase